MMRGREGREGNDILMCVTLENDETMSTCSNLLQGVRKMEIAENSRFDFDTREYHSTALPIVRTSTHVNLAFYVRRFTNDGECRSTYVVQTYKHVCVTRADCTNGLTSALNLPILTTQ